jgi:hypothetical protein
MICRIHVYLVRRKARFLSTKANQVIYAKYGGITVGGFRHGEEVK